MSEAVLDRSHFIRRGKLLEYATIGYNSLEGIAAIIAGVIAGSVALVGFGFDSAIEVISGATLLWRLYADVTFDAAKSLIRHEPPQESTVGIIVAVASLIVMPLLARAKRRVAKAIGSKALDADATQTALCTYLSAILLAGLLLNALLGWWWADPVAALVMVPMIVREGLEGTRGERCDDNCGR